MNRLTVLALSTVLLLCSSDALAQHGGHGGGRRGASGTAGSGSTSDSGLQDFNHALAVQATPDQASKFQSLAKGTEAARKQAQDLLRLAAKADEPPEPEDDRALPLLGDARRLEARRLVLGIVQLREAVGDLAPDDELLLIATGQRRRGDIDTRRAHIEFLDHSTGIRLGARPVDPRTTIPATGCAGSAPLRPRVVAPATFAACPRTTNDDSNG